MERYDYLFKFIIIGDAGTGKTCLLYRFMEDKFKSNSSHTIGVEFGSKLIEVGGKTVKLQIWDTAGQERFRAVTRSYYKGAAGCILVYDVTKRDTYNNISSWLADAKSLANKDIATVLVGNKTDLSDRQVQFLEASRFGQENNMMYIESSAFSGENVEEVFLKCARTILSKINSGILDPTKVSGGKPADVVDPSTPEASNTTTLSPSSSSSPCSNC
ncbi:GTP-binding protein RAB4 [Pelomyxa schiedti]|nr:GTP-binding protein RAB4 [Pelomyxa schiedti]